MTTGGILTKAPADKQPDAGEQMRVRFIASTAEPDREGDRIDQDGWTWDGDWVSLLWCHSHTLGPIGRAEPQKDTRQLMADCIFDPELERAQKVYRWIQNDFLKYCSVGFRPIEYSREDTGVHYQRQELLELSILPVGAHQSAQPVSRGIADEATRVAMPGEGAVERDGRVLRQDLYDKLAVAKSNIADVMDAEPRGEAGGGDGEEDGGDDKSGESASTDEAGADALDETDTTDKGGECDEPDGDRLTLVLPDD